MDGQKAKASKKQWRKGGKWGGERRGGKEKHEWGSNRTQDAPIPFKPHFSDPPLRLIVLGRRKEGREEAICGHGGWDFTLYSAHTCILNRMLWLEREYRCLGVHGLFTSLYGLVDGGSFTTFYVGVCLRRAWKEKIAKVAMEKEREQREREREKRTETAEFYQTFDCLKVFVSLLMVPEISSE